MKDCLEFQNHRAESKDDMNKISFKGKEISIRELPLSQQTYHAPRLNDHDKDIGTSGQNHNVGQLENNLFKLKRAL